MLLKQLGLPVAYGADPDPDLAAVAVTGLQLRYCCSSFFLGLSAPGCATFAFGDMAIRTPAHVQLKLFRRGGNGKY